ncbi:MAG: hypothetical protein AB7V22_03055 [Kiritimatiellia bacterium]
MNPRAIALGAAGLGLVALAAWMVPTPRLVPRPDRPEIAPFAAGERIALIRPDPGNNPPPDSLAWVRRARAAGAEVRVFPPGEALAAFAPDRIYQPFLGPHVPSGYHPDQWPALPPGGNRSGNRWQLYILSPEERIIQNAVVLEAARSLRASGTDDDAGTGEARLLSRARRAEWIWSQLP